LDITIAKLNVAMKPSSFGPYLVGALFVVAGLAHFRSPRAYESIVPPGFGNPHDLVVVSGVCEILGGVGAMLPPTRRVAGWGLILLLLAVFPANVYMAFESDKFKAIPTWLLYGRLPLQFVLLAWVANTLVRAKAN
jgi:uncharacterized membrane protein